ncbi:MAG TPA: hypothetical protein VJL10_05045 [Anaerolineales bacterium]|nr:hypothetical protein [Anaerolineales bacterium]
MTYPVAPLGYYVPLGAGRFLGGPQVNREQLLYGLEIDWDNDGLFNGSNDAFWMIPGGWESARGRENFIKSSGDGFERIDAGTCTIFLDNTDGRYTPRNVNSPLYPHLLSNEPRLVRYWVKNKETGNFYNIIAGLMISFRPQNDSRGRSKLRIDIRDGMDYLHGQNVNVDIQTGIGTDTAIGLVLDDVGWLWGRNLENGVDTIPYWWVYNRSPYTTIMNLAESELATFFIAANGDATLYTRFYSDPSPISLSSAEISPEIGESQPSETFRDRVIIRVHPLILRAGVDVWTLQDVPTFIAAGETREFWPEFKYENRDVPVQNPTVDTFTANSLSNGSGTDYSANFTLVFTPFGDGGKLAVTNNGDDAWIIATIMSGDALDSPYPVGVRTGSGQNAIEIDLSWQQKTASGQENADYLHTLLSDPTKYYLTVSMEDLPDTQFAELFRWVDLSIPSKGISDLFRITKIHHRALKRRVVRTTWWLEPTLDLAVSNLTQLPFQLPARLP